jgi:polysaccharide biosynthesis protein PslG
VSLRFRLFSRGTIAAFALVLSLASSVHAQQAVAPVTAAAASASVRPPVSPDRLAASNYGSSVFLWDNPLTTARDLRALQQADFGWQKSLFKWKEIEGAGKGIYDWTEADRIIQASNAAGIKVIARIDFQPSWARLDHATTNAHPDNPMDYADFVGTFASRYRDGSVYGHVSAIEVWNEPNLEREWGSYITQTSATDYVTLLKVAHAAIKKADPSMLVVTAGLSPTDVSDGTAQPDDQYLQWLYDAGLLGNYDVLGVQGNSVAPDPIADPGSLDGYADPSFYFRRVEQLRAIQEQNGDSEKPVWLLEFGWTSDHVHPEYAWYAVSEAQKADNILAAFQYARANWPWMGVMTVWALPDPTWGPDREEYWWAISNPDGTTRPALDRIIDAAQTGALP